VDPLCDVIDDIQWTQSVNPFLTPIVVNVIGYGGSMSWNTTYRDMSVVTSDEVLGMNRLVESMIGRILALDVQDGEIDLGHLVDGL